MSTWVLLRGLTRETGHWGAFVPLLQQRLAASRIVALDLPGNGGLHQQRSPVDIEAMTASVRQQLAAQGLAPPYRVLAMSLGAMVAVDWAQRFAPELSACVLINTSLRGFSPSYQRLRPANLPALLRLGLGTHSAVQREEIVLQLTSRHHQQDAALLAAWEEIAWLRPVTPANALRQLLAALRYRPPPQAPTVPMLLLCSQRDALVNPRCSHALARHWGLPLREHPSAGHDLPLDDPAWVISQIEAAFANEPS
jgi:pimeloyl-ACP methyl ester carboxylesterase